MEKALLAINQAIFIDFSGLIVQFSLKLGFNILPVFIEWVTGECGLVVKAMQSN